MKQFINNLMDIGFLGFILWVCFILFLHWLVNNGLKGVETYLDIEKKIYWYDFVWLVTLIWLFIYGIYKYN